MHRWCLELGADYLCCPPCLYLLCLSVLFLSPSLSLSLSPPSSFSLSLFLPLSFPLSLSSLSVLCVSVSPLPSLTHPPPSDLLSPLAEHRNRGPRIPQKKFGSPNIHFDLCLNMWRFLSCIVEDDFYEGTSA